MSTQRCGTCYECRISAWYMISSVPEGFSVRKTPRAQFLLHPLPYPSPSGMRGRAILTSFEGILRVRLRMSVAPTDCVQGILRCAQNERGR